MPLKEFKYIDKNKRLVMSRLVTREEQNDRSFDIEFWQRLTDKQRLDAAWDMVVFAHTSKGKDPDELRLQRSIENLKRR
ncbi:MAG: hypothetical protein ABI791_13990 [Acidobacteriota bacterium]